MANKEEKGVRKKNFSSEEVKLLLELVAEKSAILNSHKTNNSQPRMIKETWDQIASSYNANQTSGARTVEELKTKYKNVKASTKKNIALNKLEMRKTGGGTAELIKSGDECGFNFIEEQIVGLKNSFDCDNVEAIEKTSVSIEKPPPASSTTVTEKEEKESGLRGDKPKEFPAIKKIQGKKFVPVDSDDFFSSKQKVYEQQSELLALQITNMKLQNEYINMKIAKLKTTRKSKVFTQLDDLISDSSSSAQDY